LTSILKEQEEKEKELNLKMKMIKKKVFTKKDGFDWGAKRRLTSAQSFKRKDYGKIFTRNSVEDQIDVYHFLNKK